MQKLVSNAAEEFITSQRRAFPSLYPTDLHFLTHLASSSDYDWNEKGNIYYKYEEELKESFTERGWKDMRFAHNLTPPFDWSQHHTNSPLMGIPDHISNDWLEEIRDFNYSLCQLKDDDMLTYLTVLQNFGGYNSQYKKDNIERNYSAFIKLKAAIALSNQRCIDILNARYREEKPNIFKPRVEVGAVVHHRLKASTETANVVSLATVPLDSDNIQVAVLDKPLKESIVVRVADLIALSSPSSER